MAKALNGKELGKGITQLRNGTYQARVYIKGNDKHYDKYGEKLKEPYYLTQITSPKKEASVRKIPLTETAIKAFEDWRIKQEKDIKKLEKNGEKIMYC